MEKTYRIFISHSWNYSNQYDKVIEFLDKENLSYYNHSVPKDDPIHTKGTDKELYNAIEAKIKGCSCIIILAGVYSSYSKWIDKEIKIAQIYKKPIIAVKYWGASRISNVVREAADEIVGWNSKSLVDSIKKHAL